MRTWSITATRNGHTKLDVLTWPYKRQAYRFVIDWFTEDPTLTRIRLVDDTGRAEPLTLSRPT